MKHIKTTFFQLFLLIAIALFAGAVSAANPFVNPPAGTIAPNNNTEFPVNTGPNVGTPSVGQVKTGGLSVGTFNALANAAFEQFVYIQGLMLGAPTSDPYETNLAVGGTSAIAHLSVAGGIRSTEGLYSQEIETGTGNLIPLCSTTNGNIILCPTPPPPPPPPPNNVIKGRVAYECTDWFTWHPWPTPVDYHQGRGRFTMYFDAPTPVPITVQLAYCQDNPPLKPASSSAGMADLCPGYSIIPSIPSGYNNTPGTSTNPEPFEHSIPQGVREYSVPTNPNNGTLSLFHSCGVQPVKPRRPNTAWVSRVPYLYIKDTAPGNLRFEMTGASYQSQLTRPINMSVADIP